MTQPRAATTEPRAHTNDGTRPCARDQRCSAATIDPDTGKREPAWSPRPLCDTDRDALQFVITQFPRMYVRLHQQLLVTGAGSAGGPKVSTSKSAPIPLNTSADELLRLLVATLVSWEERVRDVARLSPLDTENSRRRRDSVAVDQAVKILTPRVDALIALQAEPMMRDGEVVEMGGADAALELFHLHWRCRAALTDGDAPARPLSTPCACGLRQLVEVVDWEGRPDGAKCRSCRAEYSQQELDDLTLGASADARARVAAQVAAHRARQEALIVSRAAEQAVHHACRADSDGVRSVLGGLSAAQRERVAHAAYAVARMASEPVNEGN
ncbi:hypothetical protein GCM10009555_017810 [Acrocarpospora macrocephala]|uniref:Uncharacterized protein n=1 Tax=Acrocarpospora macrocephala TaxID=150177 RepID=A0A5M3WJS1_9ACTN|nr:hypothetical protein [Acrocarpospora macrocephala]GES07441.1 hypothetical protein Amac_010360 [Acrocarpospora macrocephala]